MASAIHAITAWGVESVAILLIKTVLKLLASAWAAAARLNQFRRDAPTPPGGPRARRSSAESVGVRPDASVFWNGIVDPYRNIIPILEQRARSANWNSTHRVSGHGTSDWPVHHQLANHAEAGRARDGSRRHVWIAGRKSSAVLLRQCMAGRGPASAQIADRNCTMNTPASRVIQHPETSRTRGKR